MTRTGTHHYRNLADVRRAYPANYEQKLAEGSIAIGQPLIKPGDRLLVDTEGRYHIESED